MYHNDNPIGTAQQQPIRHGRRWGPNMPPGTRPVTPAIDRHYAQQAPDAGPSGARGRRDTRRSGSVPAVYRRDDTTPRGEPTTDIRHQPEPVTQQLQNRRELSAEVQELREVTSALGPGPHQRLRNLRRGYQALNETFDDIHHRIPRGRGSLADSHTSLEQMETVVQEMRFQVRMEQFDEHYGKMEEQMSIIKTLPSEVQEALITREYQVLKANAERVFEQNTAEGKLNKAASDRLNETISEMDQFHQTIGPRLVDVLKQEVRANQPGKRVLWDRLGDEGKRDLGNLKGQINVETTRISQMDTDINQLIETARNNPRRARSDELTQTAVLDVTTERLKQLLYQKIDLDKNLASERTRAQESYDNKRNEASTLIGDSPQEAERIRDALDREMRDRNIHDRDKYERVRSSLANSQNINGEIEERRSDLNENRRRETSTAEIIRGILHLRGVTEDQNPDIIFEDLEALRKNFIKADVDYTGAEKSIQDSQIALGVSLGERISDGSLQIWQLKRNFNEILREKIQFVYQDFTSKVNSILTENLRE